MVLGPIMIKSGLDDPKSMPWPQFFFNVLHPVRLLTGAPDFCIDIKTAAGAEPSFDLRDAAPPPGKEHLVKGVVHSLVNL